jgi:hypothetical protein
MARTRTLAQLRTEVEQRADIPTSSSSGTRFLDTEINRYINQSIRRFVGFLIGNYSESYFRASSTISVSSGTRSYSLPSDFYQLISFVVTIDGTRVHLERTPNELQDIDTDNYGWTQGYPTYRVLSSTVVFDPTPRASYTVTVNYHSLLFCFNSGGTAITDLSSDTDYLDGFNGWEEWVINDAAIKCKLKDEEPIVELQAVNDRIEQEIRRASANRDAGRPPRVRNHYDRLRSV